MTYSSRESWATSTCIHPQAYAQSEGIFAGISLEGAILRPDVVANDAYYGRHFAMTKLLYNEAKIDPLPREAKVFTGLLP